jgi:hypothetical protein
MGLLIQKVADKMGEKRGAGQARDLIPEKWTKSGGKLSPGWQSVFAVVWVNVMKCEKGICT